MSISLGGGAVVGPMGSTPTQAAGSAPPLTQPLVLLDPGEQLILPDPPSDYERDVYLEGGQKRWALWLGSASFLLVVASLVKFSLSHPALSPFLVVALFAAGTVVLGSLTSTRARRPSLASHAEMIGDWAPAQTPSVDVFLPSAGEDMQVLANTYFHVSRLQWQGELRVYVLDDSARQEVELLAMQYGFEYLARPDRGRLKKAGNLLFGYQNSGGEIILILDADFAPRPDMLENLVPYMDDPEVGIVQSPQFFDSDDPRMNWVQRGAGATQELFYRWVQPSRDRLGGPICVGTDAIYRREALDEAGGFAQIAHSEDVHTGVKLRKAGYRVTYVPVNLAKGLCPDDLQGFINQQYRWCAGSMSLLKDRSFHAAPMGLRQKMAFWSGFTYYISTALFVFVMTLPTIVMLWFFPEAVQPSNYVLLIPALVFTWAVMPMLLHARWSPAVLRVQLVYSFAHAIAIYDTVRGRTADWVPTGAVGEGTPLPTRVRRLMTVWVTFTLVATILGIVVALTGFALINFIPVIFLTLIALWVKLPAVLPVRNRKGI